MYIQHGLALQYNLFTGRGSSRQRQRHGAHITHFQVEFADLEPVLAFGQICLSTMLRVMKASLYMPSYLYDFIEAVVAVAHFQRILGRPVRPSYHVDRPLRILGLLRVAVRLCMGIEPARTSRALFWGWLDSDH